MYWGRRQAIRRSAREQRRNPPPPASQRTGQALSAAARAAELLAELEALLAALTKKQGPVKAVRRWIMHNPALSQDAAKAMGQVAEDGARPARPWSAREGARRLRPVRDRTIDVCVDRAYQKQTGPFTGPLYFWPKPWP